MESLGDTGGTAFEQGIDRQGLCHRFPTDDQPITRACSPALDFELPGKSCMCREHRTRAGF